MLKNVVLPAPLGPMSDTIPALGTLKDTSLTATSPPNVFVTWLASSRVPFDSVAQRLAS